VGLPNIVTRQKVDEGRRRRAVELRRQMTEAEWRPWSALRANKLDGLHFRRQQVIDGFIVDFYCHAAELVVEVDGPIHDQQEDYDAERDAILAARGLQVIRVSNEQVMLEFSSVLRSIAAQAKLRNLPP
jgi:very-short-patch-repair endonuclease